MGNIANSLKAKAAYLFVALSLAITYFYMIRPLALGRPDDKTNLWVFSAMSKSNPHLNAIYPVWRSRVAGMWISGQLFDRLVKNGQVTVDDLQDSFGLYHAVWLFAFFVMLVFLAADPLFAMVACFGCMFYMFTPKAFMYSYPWDIPSMLLFTLNYLLWRRGHYAVMLAVMFIGYPFKETIILSGVLYFFTDLSKREKLQYVIGTAAAALLMKVAITLAVDGKISLMTNQFIGGAQPNLIKDSTFLYNIGELATPALNHFLFVNGGTFILSLLLPMRTRVQKGTKAIIGIFSLASMLAGALNEFRIMLDVLPISIFAVREYLQTPYYPVSTAQAALKNATRKGGLSSSAQPARLGKAASLRSRPQHKLGFAESSHP
jgi:hypothetical protein